MGALVGSQPGALALARAGEDYIVAALGVADCDGAAVVEVAETPRVRGCAHGRDGVPGQVAISAVDDQLWLWVEDQVSVSLDGGDSW